MDEHIPREVRVTNVDGSVTTFRLVEDQWSIIGRIMDNGQPEVIPVRPDLALALRLVSGTW